MESHGTTIAARDLHQEIVTAYKNKEFANCLLLIDESLKSNPTNTHHKILQTSCWTSLNINGPETFAVLKQILKDEPKNSFAFYGIGLKYYNEGDLMESIEYLTRAIELNPTNAMQKAVELKCKAKSVMEAICDANKKFEANSFEKAMQALSSAIFTDPENIKIQEKINEIRQFFIKDLVARLEWDVKSDLTESCKKLEIEQKLTKAEELLKKGKVERANKLIQEVTESDPKHQNLSYLKGFLLYMQGSLKEAIPVLDEVIQANPELEKAKELHEKAAKLNKLIDAAAEKLKEKKHEESIELLTEVVSIDENNSRINQAAYFQRSLAHFSLANSTKAFADFKMFEALQNKNETTKKSGDSIKVEA